MPLDLIPDTIPVVGFSDDLLLLTLAVSSVAMHITPEIKQKTREQLKNWFE